MDIKEHELLNYISCPVKYQIEKNGHSVKQPTFNNLLNDMFNFMTSYFFYNGTDNLLNKAQREWDKKCKGNIQLTDKKIIEGWGYILRINELLQNLNGNIIDINVPYVVSMPGAKHSISGFIPVIIEQGNQMILIKPAFSKTLANRYILDNDLESIIHSKAVNDLYGKPVILQYFNFNNMDTKIASYNSMHYDQLGIIINNVGQAIEEKLIYPRHSFNCSTCPVNGLCSIWGTEGFNNPNPFV